ncbi:MAG: ROK family protein [Candidatus Obscuribacterales bacterium]|nr:ROK family protein [Candidatus Obscuribacterales bacterium]
MDKNQIPAIGIDLGGTKILAGLVSGCRLLGEPVKVPTPKGPDKIIDTILDIIAQFQKDNIVLGVGISTAGIVDPNSGEVLGSTGNLPGWEGTALKTIIQNKTALRTVVENDANSAAYGECHAAGLGYKTCVIMVTLGTGIGGGVILQGKLYRGAHYAGGEIGHIKISMDNRRRCTCNLWDCWETYGSGRGLQATGWELLGGVSEAQTPLAAKRDRLTTQDIIDAAGSGDIIAKKALDLYHEHVAVGMVALCHSLDPDCFVISGGMSKFVDLKQLKDLLADRTLPRVSEKLEIYPSCLGEAAGLVGAGQLVLDAVAEVEQVSVAG